MRPKDQLKTVTVLTVGYIVDSGCIRWSSAPVYYCEHKQKVKTGEAWEQGYIFYKVM